MPPIFVFSDFPGGEGESHFLNRGGREHAQGEAGLRALGLEKFEISEGASEGEAQSILEANEVLFAEASDGAITTEKRSCGWFRNCMPI